jgi:hypothetical protein
VVKKEPAYPTPREKEKGARASAHDGERATHWLADVSSFCFLEFLVEQLLSRFVEQLLARSSAEGKTKGAW